MQRNRDRRVAAVALGLAALAAWDAGASEGGLELFPDWRFQLPLLVAFFAALVPIVSRLLLQPMLRVLDARSDRTEGSRRRASRLEEQARELIGRYDGSIAEVRQSAEGSRRAVLDDARRRAAEATLAARTDAAAEIARARGEIHAAVAEAQRGLRLQAEELAREVASRVLGRSLA